jgi:hypothetical protein
MMTTRFVTGNHATDGADNLPAGQSTTEYMFGANRAEITVGTSFGAPGPDHIVLTPGSFWIGGFSAAPFSSLTISGTGPFINTGSTANGDITIAVPVIGKGTLLNQEAHSFDRLEFGSFVGSGQTVITAGAEAGASHTVVDAPHAYHAQNVLSDGDILLEGIKATSFSLKNDLLTLFNGKAAVYSMNLHVAPTATSPVFNFGVNQTAGGAAIHADQARLYTLGGNALPMHA